MKIQKSKAERVVIVLLIVIVIAMGILLFLLPELKNTALAAKTDFGNVIIGILLIFGGFYGLLFCKKREWLGELITIDQKQLSKTMPSGRSVIGKWSELIFVSPDLKVIGFADGTAIDLSLLNHSQLKRIAKISGPEGLLTAELEKRLMDKFSTVERLVLALCGVALALGIAAVNKVPILSGLWIGTEETYTVGLVCALFVALAIWTLAMRRYILDSLNTRKAKKLFFAQAKELSSVRLDD